MSSRDTPLHGREREVACLREHLGRLRAGRGTTWLIEGGAGLDRTVADLLRDGAGQTTLEPLDHAAIADVAADVLGAAPDGDIIALAEGAHGNPFWLIELLSGLRDERLVAIDAGRATLGEGQLPRRLGETMRRRLTLMSPAARDVAAVAASMGRCFTIAQLAAVLDVPASTLLHPVDELLATELLSERGGQLGFSHDLNREAVRASQPPSAARALDRQVAAALLAAGPLPVEVAVQLASSAAPGDEVAVTTLMKASDALASTDPVQAAGLARRALDLTSEQHPLRGPLVARAAAEPGRSGPDRPGGAAPGPGAGGCGRGPGQRRPVHPGTGRGEAELHPRPLRDGAGPDRLVVAERHRRRRALQGAVCPPVAL